MDLQSDTDKAEASPSLGNVPTQESTDMDAGQRAFEELCSRFIGNENIKEEDRNAVNDMRKLFQSLNDRLRNIENMMLPQGSTPPEPLRGPFPAPPVNNTNTATEVKPEVIPKIQKVAWDEFKGRDKNAPVFAIDVLIGPPKYWFQKNRASTELGIRPSSTAPSDLQQDDFKEMPDRIRINSGPLLKLLDNITGKVPSDQPRVYLQPYKSFLYYEDSIMTAMDELEVPLSAKPTSGQCAENTAVRKTSKAESESFTASRQSSIPSVWDSSDDGKGVEDLKCLIAFIKLGVKPFLPNFENGKIRFQQLWHLFKPGDNVFLNLDALTTQESMNSVDRDSRPVPRSQKTHTDRRGMYQVAWRILQIKGGRPVLRSRFGSLKGRYMRQFGGDYDEEKKAMTQVEYTPFHCSMYYLDFDGSAFIVRSDQFVINSFEGEQEITSLPFYPWRFTRDHAKLRERLIRRGREFVKYTEFRHRYHVGPTLQRTPDGYEVSMSPEYRTWPDRNVGYFEGEVIIDFKHAFKERPSFCLKSKHQLLETDPDEIKEDYNFVVWENRGNEIMAEDRPEKIDNDSAIEDLRTEDHMQSQPAFESGKLSVDILVGNVSEQSVPAPGDLPDDDLMLLPERVFGYNLKARSFQQLSIHNLKEIPQRLDGYDRLKLPGSVKQLVRGLVQSHAMKPNATSSTPEQEALDYDVVHGKGRGLILLLHGVPGVGKTSTAETVAESLRMPLWPIVCGDLGTNSSMVDRSLTEICGLADHWGCVLLLDEADVFLAQRNDRDLEQNALASVFLRQLEWFSGILILTTNRVGVIDDAFKSRIHMTLYYPPLDLEQTIEIWKMNLERAERIDELRTRGTDRPRMRIKREKILDYAKEQFKENRYGRGQWNGRQIRNAFQTASGLALHKASEKSEENGQPVAPVLTANHFKFVWGATLMFDEYLIQTKDADEAERAHLSGIRNDKFSNLPQWQTAKPNSRTTAAASVDQPLRHYQPSTQLPAQQPYNPAFDPSLAFRLNEMSPTPVVNERFQPQQHHAMTSTQPYIQPEGSQQHWSLNYQGREESRPVTYAPSYLPNPLPHQQQRSTQVYASEEPRKDPLLAYDDDSDD
ncbi:hypothetical protein DBV05_g8736 [Lasiodiplodia theobromae]|uniref:AAA+ ATPase domain-containing protein n=1 Tax=Lasiodiplodia theobromae TaxID=45133 RepID=A0A5N5D5E7_9PEZI|nr:hypothetical protein DBV05_g8736 [Lasiodiplodia theobromae]